MEFLSIHILLTPLWLVLILQYFSSPVFMTVSILVNKLDNSLIILTKPACHHNSFWGNRCDSNQAPTVSLKPCIISWRFRPLSFGTRHISSQGLNSSILMVRHRQFPWRFGFHFLKSNTFRLIPAKANFFKATNSKIL